MNIRSAPAKYEDRRKTVFEPEYADLLIRYLEKEGVKYIFGVPGGALTRNEKWVTTPRAGGAFRGFHRPESTRGPVAKSRSIHYYSVGRADRSCRSTEGDAASWR